MVKYSFNEILNCNMCGADSSSFKIMGQRLNQSQGMRPRKKTGISVSVMKCTNCGLIFSNPQPLPISIYEQYDVLPEAYWASADFTWNSSHFGVEAKMLKDIGFQFEGKKALDIGAGYGRCMLSFESLGLDAFGFEPSKPFYDLGIEKFKLHPEKFKHSSIEDINYPDAFFDFITFGAVLEHLHDPDQCLKKALTWLKPGGYIHIEVPSAKWFISKLFNFYFNIICRTNYVTNLSPMHAPYHHYEFTKDSFIKNGLINGYTIAKNEVYVCETTQPFKFLDPFFKIFMGSTKTGLQLVIFIRKNG